MRRSTLRVGEQRSTAPPALVPWNGASPRASCWSWVDQAEPTKIVRRLLETDAVTNGVAVVMEPQPGLVPFFAVNRLVESCTGGSDGGRFRGCIRPVDALVIAAPPPRRVSGKSLRASYHEPRKRKLSPEQEAAIRALAQTRSLRALAAEFGVSHETVRGALRRRSGESAPA